MPKKPKEYVVILAGPVHCQQCRQEMHDRTPMTLFQDVDGNKTYTHADECAAQYADRMPEGDAIRTSRRIVSLHIVEPTVVKILFKDRVIKGEMIHRLQDAGCYDVSDVALAENPVDMYFMTAKTVNNLAEVAAALETDRHKHYVGVTVADDETDEKSKAE